MSGKGYFNHNAFPDEGVVETGHIVDHKELPSGQILYKVRIPRKHGTNVSDDHLAWISAENSIPGALTSVAALDKGLQVSVRQNPGDGGTSRGVIVSVSNNTESKNPVISGGSNLPGVNDNVSKYKSQKRAKSVNLPPDVQESGDPVVAKVIEKGAWSLDKADGLLNSLTASPIFGSRLPQVQNLSTAIDQAEAVLSSSMIGSLPGMSFSIGNLLSDMPAALKDELFKQLPAGVGDQLESVMGLVRSYSPSSGGGSTAGKRVNPEVFFANAVNILKDVKDSNDIIQALQKIDSDDSITGMDLLGTVTNTIQTSFGSLDQIISPDGVVSVVKSQAMQAAEKAFGSLLGQVKALESISDQLGPMLDRFAPEVRGQFKSNLEAIGNKTIVHAKKELDNFFK
jgi:hypothetical protein